ncbi:MAG: DUF86 domain-containing protein [Ignavibacteriaceae bacterium]|nr:DUF86 domain-containing protein [Ignavibacteriaceae bacterium]
MDKTISTLTQIIDAGEKILKFTEKLTENEFAADEVIQYAVQRLFEIMGEGCSRLQLEVFEECGDIPCRGLKDLRNVLIHKYDVVDLVILWDTIKDELPVIIKSFTKCRDLKIRTLK